MTGFFICHLFFFFFNDTATTEIYTLSLHDALPISPADAERVTRGSMHVSDRHFTFAAPVEGVPGAYVVLSGSVPSPSLLRWGSFLTAVLLALAVASIPLAR